MFLHARRSPCFSLPPLAARRFRPHRAHVALQGRQFVDLALIVVGDAENAFRNRCVDVCIGGSTIAHAGGAGSAGHAVATGCRAVSDSDAQPLSAIRAIERDLALVAETGVYIAVDGYSMYLEDCRAPDEYRYSGRAKWALRVRAGIFNATADRAIRAFLALGWIVERIDIAPNCSNLLLRRPKTQSRLILDCSMELAHSLRPQESE